MTCYCQKAMRCKKNKKMSQFLFKFQKTSEMSKFNGNLHLFFLYAIDFRDSVIIRDNTKYEISQTTWDAVV